MSHHIVEVQDLKFSYPDKTPALQGISFRIEHGEFFIHRSKLHHTFTESLPRRLGRFIQSHYTVPPTS